MSSAQGPKKAEPEKDELSPIPAGPVSATVPSSHSHSKEESKEKSVSFDEIQALLGLAERLQESVYAKQQRVTILRACIFLIPLSFPLLAGTFGSLALDLFPMQRTHIGYATTLCAGLGAGLSALYLRVLLVRVMELLERDKRALTDVADMLREAGGVFSKDLSPVGRFIMRVQTWRLDIGVNPDPNAPRSPGGRASHLPPSDDPPRR